MTIEIKSAADVESLLLRLVKEGSPEDSDCIVEPHTIPNRDINGFDSLTALEVLTELEEETGLNVEEDVFFVDMKAKKYRSIREIALAVWNELQEEGKTNA